ncbi:MAG: amidase family protein [Gammaproteobacteria bacterium]|nr:amidase family protein [Gammaproteobacteria bacterium]MDP2141819.1 amidase family protein [Gammaproteobacteria bacterium]MDP2348310.1 amidase family protein [Gammaproteobacteria bacterium]
MNRSTWRLSYLALCLVLVLPLTSERVNAQNSLDIGEASIRELQLAMEMGTLNSVSLVAYYLARVAAYDDQGPALNALLHINPNARAQAAALDAERRVTGPRGPLHGIPVILKDNYATVDMPTTGASQALADFIPDANATQVQRLLDAGAIILAKANLHEFAYGITTISSLGGQTRNPYNPAHIPGGSSGGTAAAVAAGFAAIGMGSDTCGSIRIPAAFNNLVGLRPTKGVSSIYGVMPLSATQDVAGPLARSIQDLAVVLDVVSGYDPLDAATAPMQGRAAMRFREQLGTASLQGVRIGRLSNYYDSADEAVKAMLDDALAQMQTQGAIVVDVSIPGMSELISRSGVIGHEFEADLNAWLAEFGSTEYTSLEAIVAAGLHHEAVDTVLTRSAESEQDPVRYQASLAARAELRAAIDAAMQAQQIELLAYPPAGALPVRIGEPQPGNNCSLSANSGLPALSVPIGFSTDGLPMGIELLGAQFSDARLLALGYAYEQIAQHRRTPATTPSLTSPRR